MRKFYVYIYFRMNGIPAYVGKGCGARWSRHKTSKNSNPHLRSLIAQANAIGRELPVVLIRDGLSEEEAHETEIAFIAAIGRETEGGPLVNLTEGGEGTSGWVATPEFRDKCRDRMNAFYEDPANRLAASARSKGNKHNINAPRTEEWCGKISQSLIGNQRTLGYRHTEESRAKMSASGKGKPKSPEWIAKLVARQTGAVYSDERRANMSAALKGRKLSDEHRAAISKAISKGWESRELSDAERAARSERMKGKQYTKGLRHSPESIEKMRKARNGRTTVYRHSPETKEKMSLAARSRKGKSQ